MSPWSLDPDLTSDPGHADASGMPSKDSCVTGLVVMPNFSKLLTDQEMRLVAEYVVNCLQGKQRQACP